MNGDFYAPAVVYQSTVVYQAPVIYQAPVVYLGPVYYGGVLSQGCPAEFGADSYETEAPSIVIHIGGGQSYARANYGNCGSSVIHFGGAQAAAQGYHFGGR